MVLVKVIKHPIGVSKTLLFKIFSMKSSKIIYVTLKIAKKDQALIANTWVIEN